MKRVNYNQKTRDYLKAIGFLVGNVERWIQQTMQRQDLFGIIDLIAITDRRTVGVQSTSMGAHSAHVNKILWSPVLDEHNKEIAKVPNPNTRAWLNAGRELMLICWAKRKVKRGGVAFRYEPVIEYFTKEQFEALTREKI